MNAKKLWVLGLVGAAMAIGGCAVEGSGEDLGESEDAIRDEPIGYCRADGYLRKGPSASAEQTAGVNEQTKLNVFCKQATASEGVWVAANIRAPFAKSYLWSGALKSCEGRDGRAIAPATFLANLPACPAPSAGSTPDGGSATPPPPSLRTPPPDAVKKRNETFTRSGHFNEPIWVGRTGNGTFTIGAVWNAYDARGALKGSGSCPEGTWSGNYTGTFDCYGSSTGAARFDVVYYARGRDAAKASF